MPSQLSTRAELTVEVLRTKIASKKFLISLCRVMAKVELKNLPKNEVQRAIDYLSSKLRTRVTFRGSSANIESASDKDVKMVLGKFLHSRYMDSYRVISTGGTVEVLLPKPAKEHVKIDHRTSAPAATTMPYYFPQTTVVKPARKRKQ